MPVTSSRMPDPVAPFVDEQRRIRREWLQWVTGGGLQVVVDLADGEVTGILPVPHGGTGRSSLTNHGVVIGAGVSTVNVTSAGTAGQVLTSNGASADPTFQASGGGTVTHTAGALALNQLVRGNAGADIKTTAATDGQIPIGKTSDGSVNLATITPGSNITITNSAGAITINASGTVSNSGGLIGVQTITATGAYTYTPTAGTNSVVIELQGAGGGGSGVAQPGGSNIAIGAAGSGGGYLRVRLTSNFSGGTGSVGAKGTGGSAGNNNGTAGGNTTFVSTTPTTYTASGGGAGNFRNGPTAAPFNIGTVLGGGATNGDVNIPGGDVPFATVTATSIGNGPTGGASHSGFGGRGGFIQGTNASEQGHDATNYGAGGGGAVATGTGAAVGGGNGSDGYAIFWEFS